MAVNFVAEKILGIKPEKQPESRQDRVTRGESIISNYSETRAYLEDEPTSLGWIKEHTPGTADVVQYVRDFFPL